MRSDVGKKHVVVPQVHGWGCDVQVLLKSSFKTDFHSGYPGGGPSMGTVPRVAVAIISHL